MNKIITFFNSHNPRYALIISLVASLLIFIFAIMFTSPRIDLYSQGFTFSELSSNPFIIHQGNSLHYRIFFPFTSWLFRLSGSNIVLMALIFSALNIFVIIYGTLKKGFSVLQAILAGLVLAITIPTQFPLVYGGFPDALIYFLILLLLFTVERGWLYWLIAGLSLFTHESILLLFPFLLLYRSRYKNKSNIRWIYAELLPAFLLMFGLYLSYRFWVNAHMVSDVLRSGAEGSQMYCVLKALDNPLNCVRQANLIGILFPLSFYGSYYYFLLIPVIIFCFFIKHKKTIDALEYIAISLACLGTFPINLDTTRIIGIILLPLIVLSLWKYFQLGNKLIYVYILAALTLFSPHFYVINGTLRYFLGFFNLWEKVILSNYPNIDIIPSSTMHIEKTLIPTVLVAVLVLTSLVIAVIKYCIIKKEFKEQ